MAIACLNGAGKSTFFEAHVKSSGLRFLNAPTMAGITRWNLGDGTAVQGENEAQGGLMDEDGVGGDNAADCLRYLVATKARTVTQRKLSGV